MSYLGAARLLSALDELGVDQSQPLALYEYDKAGGCTEYLVSGAEPSDDGICLFLTSRDEAPACSEIAATVRWASGDGQDDLPVCYRVGRHGQARFLDGADDAGILVGDYGMGILTWYPETADEDYTGAADPGEPEPDATVYFDYTDLPFDVLMNDIADIMSEKYIPEYSYIHVLGDTLSPKDVPLIHEVFRIPDDDGVAAIYDASDRGTLENGLVICHSGVYYRDLMGRLGHRVWADPPKIRINRLWMLVFDGERFPFNRKDVPFADLMIRLYNKCQLPVGAA